MSQSVVRSAPLAADRGKRNVNTSGQFARVVIDENEVLQSKIQFANQRFDIF
jgi:hypothetical protein